MNSVQLIGRLTKDPEVRYTSSQMCVAAFTLAVDRDGRKDENGEKQTDFPRVKVFGKQAEAVEKYTKKGKLVAVQGQIQTGSYQDRNGNTVYTTDVVANRVEVLEWEKHSYPAAANKIEEPKQFEMIDEDVPF